MNDTVVGRSSHITADQPIVGQSELATLMRSYDWAKTPLGPPHTWPEALKISVRIMLSSRQPIWIGWGPELTYLYNDPYKSIIGGKHPWALGKPTSQVWREIWSEIGPMLDTAMHGDTGTYVEEQLLIMERNGYPEETYYTYSYSPIPTADGTAGGIICANTDDTQRVISERQVALLRELAAGAGEARSWQQACELSVQALATNRRDITFAALYMVEQANTAVRVSSTGLRAGHAACPTSLLLDDSGPWPIAKVLLDHKPQRVSELPSIFGDNTPTGAWTQPSTSAILLPITSSGETGRAGVLIVGLNPFRLYDDNYAGFLDLAARQVAAAIANAEAYEQERRRAEALAEIDRAKTAFFSNVSHEFRTPLTLMLGPLEEVLSKAADDVIPANRALVSAAHRNGVRLLKMVNSLLDFSRLEAGKAQARYEPVDLAAFTAELASTFRSAIDRAGLSLRVDAPPLAKPVHVDRDMWEKIVLNLLSNALKFTFDGEISVEVGPSPDGKNAELRVRDTGTGIPEAEVPHLFERFHRVQGARGRSIEGSGIGLALVQELVKMHGGTVTVESTVDRGSVFTVSLPFGTRHLPDERLTEADAQPPSPVRAEAYVQEAVSWLAGEDQALASPAASGAQDLSTPAPSGMGAGRRVLLADDNADMRHYVERLLTHAGYRVDAVADGREALEAARRHRPDMILSDVMMPELDGFALLTAVREDKDLRDTPVILLSARAGEEAKVEGLRAGADDYLTKPFSTRELLARVETNLNIARTRRETARLLEEEAQVLELLNEVGNTVAAEIDLERAVQVVTDAATRLSGAAFGAFFYNVLDDKGESYTLYTLSGAPREAFSKFPMPRNTEVFGPTFRGEGIVRSPDIRKDPRFGKNPPYYGHPKGHLPVASYLAAPVVSRTGEVLGGLFFGHPRPDVFDERAERILAAIAVQAAIAIDKARLYRAAQEEIGRRRKVEEALRENEQQLETKVAERTAELANANANLIKEAAQRAHAEGRFQSFVEGVADYALFMLDPDGIIQELRAKFAEVPGIRTYIQNPPAIQVGGRQSKAQYQYTLQSTDLDALYAQSGKVVQAFRALPGFQDVTTDLDLNSPSIAVQVDRDRLAPLGLTMAQVQSALGAAFGENQVSTIYGTATQYWVILQVERALQNDPNVLARLYVSSSSGKLIPLDTVAHFRREPQVLTVNHQGQLPAVTVSFNLAPGVSLSAAVSEIDRAMGRLALPATISGSIQGTAQAFPESMQGMGLLLLLAVFVIYLVLGILYESFIHPLTILSGLPAAAVGALLTLVLFHAPLDLFAFVGIVMLIGIVKKNAIMLIDFALERQREEGMPPAQAIFEACRVRFRPIMMTTMAAFAGTLPIALGIGAGAETRRSLGLAVVGGLVVSQVLTLYLTPVIYLAMDRLQQRFGRGPKTLAVTDKTG